MLDGTKNQTFVTFPQKNLEETYQRMKKDTSI